MIQHRSSPDSPSSSGTHPVRLAYASTDSQPPVKQLYLLDEHGQFASSQREILIDPILHLKPDEIG